MNTELPFEMVVRMQLNAITIMLFIIIILLVLIIALLPSRTLKEDNKDILKKYDDNYKAGGGF